MLTRAQIKAIAEAERLLCDAQANIRSSIFFLRVHRVDARYFSTEPINSLLDQLRELLKIDCDERLAQHASNAEIHEIEAAA